MAGLITWDSCFYAVANYHFASAYEGVWIIILAALCLFAYYAFQVLYERTSLKKQLSEEKAELVCRLLIQFAALLLVGFLIYFFFFFKPDAMQVQADAMARVVNSAYFIQQMI